MAGTHIRLTTEGIRRAERSISARNRWIQWLDSEAEIDRNLIDLDEEDIEKLLDRKSMEIPPLDKGANL